MTPTTEHELAEAIASAQSPLRIIGGGTRDIGRPAEGQPLKIAGLSGVSLYEPGALTLVAQAGTPVAEIEAVLAGEGQRLAFEPMDHRGLLGTSGTPTLGGMVAANISGPRRVQVGACRDFLLGVRYIDGLGRVIKNGGRVMKNVTGYDLVKLMVGSWGTLGVLTEVSLKVLPVAESAATVVLPGLDIEAGLAAMARALGSPYEINGAAYRPDIAGGSAFLRIEGLTASVDYRLGRLRDMFSGGEVEVLREASAVAPLWAAIRDVTPLAAHPVVWRVHVRPGAAAAVLAAIRARFDIDYLVDWGGGLVWIAMGEHPPIAESSLTHSLIQSTAAAQGGHATLIKGPKDLRSAVRVFQPEAPAVAALTAALRGKFDPKGLLNPGKMI